jgi:hypothetical protein
MALIQFSAVVGDARKKVGGVVFTKGHAGAFVRRKVSPIQPRSQSQRNVRASFTAHSKAWATLTTAAIASFNALAKSTPKKDRFGNSITLTGLQLFQQLSRNIDTVSGTPLTTAPASLTEGTPGALTVVTSAGTPTFTVAPTTYPPTGSSMAIYASPQISPGRNFVGKNYKLVSVLAYSASPTAANILSAYTSLFGSLIAGKNISVLCKLINKTSGAAGIASSNFAPVGA